MKIDFLPAAEQELLEAAEPACARPLTPMRPLKSSSATLPAVSSMVTPHEGSIVIVFSGSLISFLELDLQTTV